MIVDPTQAGQLVERAPTKTEERRWDRFDERGSKPLSPAAETAIRDMEATSGRRVDTPIRKHFVRAVADERPPLARLYTAGGRGREVALKLYLALVWRCSSAPYSTQKPARFWAALLNLDDPDHEGARRVQRGMAALREVGLIQLTPDPGFPTLVTLLDEHADGADYTLPSSTYSRVASRTTKTSVKERHTYFLVPTKLWTTGMLQQLGGPGLVMLLILLAEQAGNGAEVWFGTKVFRDRYRISHKTRAEGTAELLYRGLISIRREPLPETAGQRSFDVERRRNVYKLKARARIVPKSAKKAKSRTTSRT